QAMTIFADLAVGGSWAGAPDFSSTGGQAAMKIDYIKVWDSNPYTSGSGYTAIVPTQSAQSSQSAVAPSTNTAITISDPTAITHAEGDAGTSWYVYTVTRTGDLSQASTANYAVTGYGANPASASDFDGGVLPTGEIWFGGGESVKQIWVPVTGDTTAEADEQFAVNLSNPTGAQILNNAALGTILNDDAGYVAPSAPASASAPGAATTISLSGDVAQAEGNDGTHYQIYTVTRAGDLSGPTTAEYAVSGYGANPASASDFSGGVLPSNEIWFGGGESVKQIWVPVAGDTTPEADEQFALTLSNPTGAQILNGAAHGTILNDDAGYVAPSAPAPDAATTISLSSDIAQAEGNDGIDYQVYTVTRAGDLSGPTTAFYAVTPSGASPASASDFEGGVFPSNEIWFGGGESVKQVWIPVVGDTTPEPDEHFDLTLSNATGAEILNGVAHGTILNDDGWIF
ncbi:MAG TPA: Calx-beta domain-containing protein, partial [Phenylobacterium sp.]|uniref:Calx-beta domain-containing protein n=1 Tax=Phenylobacterium sp. TaxID=1871053 RepID=UPI002D0395CF